MAVRIGGPGVVVGKRRAVSLAGGGWTPYVPTYLYYDTFATDLAAGAVSGTNAEPGPGTRGVTDTGNRVSQSLGEMIIASGGASSDPVWRAGTSISRVAGLTLVSYLRENQIEATAQMVAEVGFDNNNTGNVEANRFRFTTGGTLNISNTTQFGAVTNVGSYAANTLYGIAISFLATKAIYSIKGGAWAEWTLLGSLALHASSTFYPSINASNRQMAVKNIAVTTLPAALSVDSVADSPLSSYMIYCLNQIAPVNLLTGQELT